MHYLSIHTKTGLDSVVLCKRYVKKKNVYTSGLWVQYDPTLIEMNGKCGKKKTKYIFFMRQK